MEAFSDLISQTLVAQIKSYSVLKHIGEYDEFLQKVEKIRL